MSAAAREAAERAAPPGVSESATRLLAMGPGDVDAVMAIEQGLYDFPWTRGNFIDSLHAGHVAQVLRAGEGPASVLGYVLAMGGIEEMHLLNLSVAAPVQRQGHARRMLDSLCRVACRHGARTLWLEVRPSNARALAVYERYGFARIGLRRGYYPDHGQRREDAIVMSLSLAHRSAENGT